MPTLAELVAATQAEARIRCRTTTPKTILLEAADKIANPSTVATLTADLLREISTDYDIALFHYDCAEGCDSCGFHVEAWCDHCDAPLVADAWAATDPDCPQCTCFRGKAYAIACYVLGASPMTAEGSDTDGRD